VVVAPVQQVAHLEMLPWGRRSPMRTAWHGMVPPVQQARQKVASTQTFNVTLLWNRRISSVLCSAMGETAATLLMMRALAQASMVDTATQKVH